MTAPYHFWSLTLALLASSGAAQAAGVKHGPEIVAFCRMHPDLDHPDTDGVTPDQVEAIGATHWRCMGGAVLLCQDSADGANCSRKKASRTPSAILRETCADNPGQDYVSRAAMGGSASSWRCKGRTPVIVATVKLDRRGFMQPSWLRYVVRNGVVMAPHADDFGTDPR